MRESKYDKILELLKANKGKEYSVEELCEKFEIRSEQQVFANLRRLRYTDNIKLKQIIAPLIIRKKLGLRRKTYFAKYDEEYSNKVIKEEIR